MTIRQRLLQLVYPLFMWFRSSTVSNKDAVRYNEQRIAPKQSVYSLTAIDTSGNTLDFADLQGKKLLIVNTASNCGYTPQLEELQQLQDAYNGRLVVIAFASNDFKQQEPLGDNDIGSFCRTYYGVGFPIIKKSTVKKKAGQHPVFEWLTHQDQNGWLEHSPPWNFSKYLVDEQGVLLAYFPSFVSPLSEAVRKCI